MELIYWRGLAVTPQLPPMSAIGPEWASPY